MDFRSFHLFVIFPNKKETPICIALVLAPLVPLVTRGCIAMERGTRGQTRPTESAAEPCGRSLQGDERSNLLRL